MLTPMTKVLYTKPALTYAGKNGPLDHFGPILIDKANGLVI